MKRTTAIYAVTALAALSLAGQAFARGGSMGGGQGHGSSGGTQHMASGFGTGIQQRSMQSNGGQAAGSGTQHIQHSGLGSSAGHLNGSGSGSTTPRPAAASASR
ncbi:MAG: hypothetical protein M0T70_11675 [Geobacteraceae bacterium]|nr:hypothetical protein [Geobacteraceae bacterium]